MRRFGCQRWLTLLACLAAAAARAQVDVAGGLKPPEAGNPPSAEAAASPGSGLKWRPAPVITSGSISYDLRTIHARDEPSSRSQVVSLSLNSATYIYQPWLATVNGTIQLSTASTRYSYNDNGLQGPFASPDGATSSDKFITGRGQLNLFPQSRFPFEVHADRSDTRTASGLIQTLDYISQNIGFSQRYRPASNDYSVSARYDRREYLAAGARDIQDVLEADYATRWKNQQLTASGSLSDARRSNSDDRSVFRSLVGQHTYEPASTISFDTRANLTQTQEHLTARETDLSALQLSSIGLWRPPDSKLTLTGGARALLMRDGLDDAYNRSSSLGLTLGASYEYNRNVRLTANGGIVTTNASGTGTHGVSGGVGASWQSDTIQIHGLQYDWFASGNLGATRNYGSRTVDDPFTGTQYTASRSESQGYLSTNVGHALNRAWPITSQSGFTLNLTQTLSSTWNRASFEDAGAGPTDVRNLLQSVHGTWNVNGDDKSAYARLSYSEAREIGGRSALFQLANFQLSGNFNFDRYRSLGGDLTWQHTTQRLGETPLFGLGTLAAARMDASTVGGEINYRHQRLFSVNGLRFTSRLKLAQDVLNQPGTLPTIPDRETRLWENRLDWLIGLLDSQLIFRISEVDGRRRDFLMFRVQRNFGN